MLPSPFSPLYFRRVDTRALSDAELQPARETRERAPHHIRIAVLVALVFWPITVGVLMGLDALFGPDDESWLKFGLAIVFFIGGIYVMPTIAICRVIEMRGELADACAILKAERVEMWQRLPPEEFEDSQEAFEMPRVIEVIAGTERIWREEWDKWLEDEKENAQLPGLNAS